MLIRPDRLLVLGIGLYLTGPASAAPSAAGDACTHTIISTLPSPDRTFLAHVDEALCDADGPATAVIDSVVISGISAKTEMTDLLGVDTGGNAAERPRLSWTSGTTLRVTVPNRSFLKIVTRRAGPISLDLRFDPPDAVARAAWLRALNLPLDGASVRP